MATFQYIIIAVIAVSLGTEIFVAATSEKLGAKKVASVILSALLTFVVARVLMWHEVLPYWVYTLVAVVAAAAVALTVFRAIPSPAVSRTAPRPES